jgi:hypothetical protein
MGVGRLGRENDANRRESSSVLSQCGILDTGTVLIKDMPVGLFPGHGKWF